ncbi:spore germination protein [Paenibacillus sp. LHD-38]|uniref:spore germination protein n=1 Tax=Paenibacillus sp. LHD-38 TaxID=3072143 RepID=UPI00280FD7E3|nr:spore germination protein [Paenibacillus sp. LHD-38]MDQ8737119.1 spore germination protein [Paenibacillus sp. LHD-38]
METTPQQPISPSLEDNLNRIKDTFSDCKDLAILPWSYGPNLESKAFSVYFFTLVQEKHMNYLKTSLQDLVMHEFGPATTVTLEDIVQFFSLNGVSSQSVVLLNDFEQAVHKVLNGHAVIFFDGWEQAISYAAKSIEARQVAEAINEATVQGPREGTVESLDKNIGMLRARIKSPDFKIEWFTAGKECKTDIMYGYMKNAVNPATLQEFQMRIDQIDKSIEITDPSYIEALIEDSTYSPFPQYRHTERTDTAATALMEGKIIVMAQGSPTILICPGLFVEFLMTSEDYYQRTIYASMIRLIRVVSFFISTMLPSIYIAFTTFHPLNPAILRQIDSYRLHKSPFGYFELVQQQAISISRAEKKALADK